MSDVTETWRGADEGAERTCPSELALERWRRGETAADGVRVHVEGCARCQARVAALAEARPPELNLDALWAEAALRRGVWGRTKAWLRGLTAGRFVGWSLVLAGATAAAVLAPRLAPGTTETTKGPGWRLGVIVRQPDGKQRHVEPGEALRPGDQLRFEVFAPTGRAHVAVFSLDAAGVVSKLAPAGARTLEVAGGARRVLDEAVELDGVLGPERIVMVACPQSRGVDELATGARAALLAAGKDPRRVGELGVGCDEVTFWIEKVAP